MHKSVGGIVKNESNEILMVDRVFFPFGWACPAGHVESNESPEDALKRELKEEANIEVKKNELLFHEFLDWDVCRRGEKGHDWYFYLITDWSGEIKNNDESKKIEWISIDKIGELNLTPTWKYWLEKSNLI